MTFPQISTEQYLASKEAWTQGKKNMYRTAFERQKRTGASDSVKRYQCFLKKGEQAFTKGETILLPGEKTRPRLIWNPKYDTFGLPAVLNH